AQQPEVFPTSGYDWCTSELVCDERGCGADPRATDRGAWSFALEHEQLVVLRRGRRLGAIPLGPMRVGLAATTSGANPGPWIPAELMTIEGRWPGGSGYRLSVGSL